MNRFSHVPRYVWVLLVSGLVVSLVLAVYYISPQTIEKFFAYLGRKIFLTPPGQTQATPRPSPIPLATGKQTYMISGSLPGAAKIAEATIDPIDPATATLQKLTLQVLDTKGVTEVKATVWTDNKTTPHQLSLKSGTKTDGIWEGSWSLSDSYDYRYGIVLKAKNEDGLWTTNSLTFR